MSVVTARFTRKCLYSTLVAAQIDPRVLKILVTKVFKIIFEILFLLYKIFILLKLKFQLIKKIFLFQ